MLQIKELTEGSIKDAWLEWSRKAPEDLTHAERLGMLEGFFMIHHDNMLRPYPRYAELFAKRGSTWNALEARNSVQYWSHRDLRDLQVWYNLAWCGFAANRLYPELGELKRKGRDFTEAEKHRVLAIHMEILNSIPARYAAAEERGQVELTTTPFFHPILPLVYDTDFMERCMPGRNRPPRFHWPEDAAAQLRLAVEQHTAMFGRAPRGLWPSEGSVAPEIVPLMCDAGFEYFCTDEENLFRSLSLSGESADHLELFQGWAVEHEGLRINAIFREKPLSDFIGFMAARNDPRQSAGHLLMHLRHIADIVPPDTGMIPIILDGENAWETFRDGGEGFLREVYLGLEQSGGLLQSSTVEQYFAACPPRRLLRRLHSGSWIGAAYDIWIGEDEENRAWELLGKTRRFLQERMDAADVAASALESARLEIYAAEGSDWFWWYGPDFHTDCDAMFDELFRQHLKNVYSLCGHLPPAELDVPLIGTRTVALYTRPTRRIAPRIDGRAKPYFEWFGAGRYTAGSEAGAMYRSERVLDRIEFGVSAESLFLRVELKRSAGVTLVVQFQEPAKISASIPDTASGSEGPLAFREPGHEIVEAGQYACRDSVEMEIPFSALHVHPGMYMAFQVKVFVSGIEVERYPESATIHLAAPDGTADLAEWIV
jgi:alpha-amylase/alpha-mannosidase (GH57 family)